MTPGELALMKERAKAQADKEAKELQEALGAALENPGVRIVLRWLARESGFFKNPRVLLATGDVSATSTIYNVGRESLYLDLRRKMTDEVRTAVERKGEGK